MKRIKSVIYLFFLFSCSAISQERQAQKCLPIYVNSIKANPLTQFLRTAFYDSLEDWNNRSIAMVEQYKNGKFNWRLDDIILFNEDSTRAILFLDKIFKDNHNFDLIKTIPAEKIDNKWWFYYKGYVEFAHERNRKDIKPTYNELSYLIINRFMDDGMIINTNCEFQYKFINTKTWFGDERRVRHFDEFLTNR